MRSNRIKTIGLALVAVFALSAAVVSAAQAGEYYYCKKLTTSTGKWEKGCETANTKSEGKYEKVAGPGPEPKYTSKTGVALLKSAEGEIECKASTDKGEVTGAKTDTDTITFTKCVLLLTGGACTTEGQASGTIKTHLLDTSLIDHGEKGLSGLEPAVGEVWTQFVSSEGEPYQAEFTCSGVKFRVSGSLSCKTTPVNVMTSSFTLTCAAAAKKEGEQDLKLETNGGAGWSAAIASEEITEGTITTKEATEIRAT